MATLIRRSEMAKRLEQLKEKADEAGDGGGKWIEKAYNALMSCKVQERIFCANCGATVKTARIPEEARGGR